MTLVNTQAMKTAISVPDPIFEAVERLAQRLGKSRSQLYTEALQTYLAQQRDAGVTERLDEIYGAEPQLSELDTVLDTIQWQSLPKEEW
jgi:predicted transcriptional regulator